MKIVVKMYPDRVHGVALSSNGDQVRGLVEKAEFHGGNCDAALSYVVNEFIRRYGSEYNLDFDFRTA